jgi:hypothetical protein
VKLRGVHAFAIVCGDDRFLVQQTSHLIQCCNGGAFWACVVAGGPLDLTSNNPTLAAYRILLEREMNKFIAAKNIPEQALIDILLLWHLDCGFARVRAMNLLEQLDALYESKKTIEDLFGSPRFAVRTGFHMVWDGDRVHRTYELDVPSAINDILNSESRPA